MSKSFLLLFFKKEDSYLFEYAKTISGNVKRAVSARKKKFRQRRRGGMKDFRRKGLSVFSACLRAVAVIFLCFGAWS
jgi:hypothetical protein